jgi:hypothetical protein
MLFYINNLEAMMTPWGKPGAQGVQGFDFARYNSISLGTNSKPSENRLWVLKRYCLRQLNEAPPQPRRYIESLGSIQLEFGTPEKCRMVPPRPPCFL